MLRFFNRLTGTHRDKHRQSSRRIKRRKLLAESLETRKLLAGDFFHNHLDAEDVNDDGIVSAVDALSIINAMGRRTESDGQMFTDVNNDGLRTASDALRVINRIGRDRELVDRRDRPSDAAPPHEDLAPGGDQLPDDHRPGEDRDPGNTDGGDADLIDTSILDEVRSIDGIGNNIDNPLLGSADQPLLRVGEADYADGISEPAGDDRPSTREISNVLSAADPEGTRNDRDLSAFIYVWGQFLDHDIDHTPTPDDEASQESFDIEVPEGDPSFDPSGTGAATIPLTRSEFDSATGTSVDNPRQQISDITAFVDGSQVYGSDQETADSLREFAGGRMLVTEDGLLPSDGEGGVLAGDVRAAENIALTSLQTLFVREHNQLADDISAENPELSDEQVYQQARAIVIAEIQSITYNEYLPALLGEGALSEYNGYDPTVNPTIANEFSTAAFRFGHSTLNDDIEFFGNDGRAVSEELSLAEAFFNPGILEETGIDSVLKYDASTLSQEVDLEVVDSLRNFLFGEPGQGGLDLVALNIQRGRDHGLNDYNSTREAYGLETYESFDQITSDVELQEKLESLYGDVDNIDLWVGLLAEDHTEGASVGELTGTIISDQFERVRDGDRFWYENVFSESDVQQLNETTLAEIIERNTTVEGLQENVFFFSAEVTGTVSTSMNTVDSADSSNRRSRAARGTNRSRGGVEGAAGITVELLNDEGDVVDTTVTDRRGNYSFRSFAETGDYQIRIAANQSVDATGDNPVDILISSGEARLQGVNLSVTT